MATNTTITISAVDKTKQAFDSVDRSLKKMTSAFSAAQAAVGSLVASFAVKEFTGFLDAATRIENKLKLVTESSMDLAKAQSEVFRVSQITGAGLEQTADLYSKIVSSTEALNLSSKEQVRITETISKAISISGASAEGAAGAITQLGQALGSGALRGEEFNSVNEQAPRIMQALADSLGIPRGQLKKLASDGVLTADIVTEALLIQSQTIDEEYGKTTTTVAESFTKLKNSAVVFFGVLDDNTGISTLFSEALSRMARGLNNVTDAMAPATVQSLSKEIRELSNAQAKELLALDKLVTENTNLNVIQQNQARIMRLNTAERAEKIKKLRAELDGLNSVVAAQKEENKETGNATGASKLSAEMLERRRKLREQLNKLTGGTLELSKEEINYQNKIYEIGKKNSLMTGEVSEANKAYFESVKSHLTDAEAVMAAKQQEAVHAASSVLSAMTLKDATEGIGRLLATQGDTQTQLAAAVEAERVVREKVSSLAAATGDESQRQKEVLQGMLPALGAQVNYLQDALASEQSRAQEGVALAQKALLEQSAYEAIVAEVNQITEQQRIQSDLDLAQKALTEQAAYEQVLVQVEKITEQMRIQEGIDLAMEAIQRQQAEDESLKLLEKQAKTAMDIASALDAAENLRAIKEQEEALKAQAESVKTLNDEAGAQLAQAVRIGQLQEDQALALAEQIGAQDAFNKRLRLTSDLYSYIKDEAGDLNKAIQEGAKNLAADPTFQAVTGAAGASGGRAASIAQATAEGGLEKGLLALVLSNEKVQEALGKVFDALFALIDPVINMLVPIIDALVPVIDAMQPIFEKLQRPIEKLAPLLVKLIELLEPLIDAILFLVEGIESVFGAFENAMQGIFQPILNSFNGLGSMFREQLVDPLSGVFERMLNGLQEFGGAIQGTFEQVALDFKSAFENLIEGIEYVFEQIFSGGVFNFVEFIRQRVVDIFKAFVPGGTIPLLPNPFHAFGLGPRSLLEFKFAKGGYLNGPSHAAGGMPAMVGGRMPVELEGGEFIIRKSAVDQLGTNLLGLLNSVTDSGRKKQINQLLGPAMSFGAGGLAQGLLANSTSFGKASLSLRDLGSVGNLIADAIGNFGAELKLGIPNIAEGRIGRMAAGGLISEGATASPVNYGFEAGNDLLGRIKVGMMGRFFPPAIGLNASYSKPSWWPFAQGGSIPTLRGVAMGQNYQSAPKIDVNIYDGTGQLISEYDSAIRVEIKERAARFGEFPAVA